MENNEIILKVSDLSKNYNSFSLSSINFNVQKGKITGFIGINGSGKTTTIKSLAGLIIPSGGKIEYFGEEITSKNESRLRNRIGFLLDGDYYYPELTLKQMKNIVSGAYSDWDEHTFNSYIKKFDLPLNKKIGELSKGMKTQYMLSLALSHHAELLIMDEPTSGLDPLVRLELMRILKQLASQGIGILFSSHITSDLEEIADNIVFIHKGNLVFQKTIQEIKSSYFAVEGSLNELTSENKKLFLNIRKYADTFKAIYVGNKNDIVLNFPNVKIASATIDDIMIGNIYGCEK